MRFERHCFNNSNEIISINGVEIYPFSAVLAGADLGVGVRVQSFSIVEPGTVIGEGTTLHPHTLTSGQTVIGRNCFVSSFVGFIDRLRTTYEEQSQTYIGDNVFIGTHAIIFPSRIGDGAVIGAGAIVLADVLPGEMVHGVWKGRKSDGDRLHEGQLKLQKIRGLVDSVERRAAGYNPVTSSPYIHVNDIKEIL